MVVSVRCSGQQGSGRLGVYPILSQGPGEPLSPSSTRNGANSDLWESESGIFFSVNDITLAAFAVNTVSSVTGTLGHDTYRQGNFTTAPQLLSRQYVQLG